LFGKTCLVYTPITFTGPRSNSRTGRVILFSVFNPNKKMKRQLTNSNCVAGIQPGLHKRDVTKKGCSNAR
jgi:hypothetical protein